MIDMSGAYPFKTYDEFKVWLESTDPQDKYGFYKKPSNNEDLKFNLCLYKQYLLNGSKFPREIHEKLSKEFLRERETRSEH